MKWWGKNVLQLPAFGLATIFLAASAQQVDIAATDQIGRWISVCNNTDDPAAVLVTTASHRQRWSLQKPVTAMPANVNGWVVMPGGCRDIQDGVLDRRVVDQYSQLLAAYNASDDEEARESIRQEYDRIVDALYEAPSLSIVAVRLPAESDSYQNSIHLYADEELGVYVNENDGICGPNNPDPVRGSLTLRLPTEGDYGSYCGRDGEMKWPSISFNTLPRKDGTVSLTKAEARKHALRIENSMRTEVRTREIVNGSTGAIVTIEDKVVVPRYDWGAGYQSWLVGRASALGLTSKPANEASPEVVDRAALADWKRIMPISPDPVDMESALITGCAGSEGQRYLEMAARPPSGLKIPAADYPANCPIVAARLHRADSSPMVCNSTPTEIYISVGLTDDSAFKLKGWFKLHAGECMRFSNESTDFYVLADQMNTSPVAKYLNVSSLAWAGDSKLCVSSSAHDGPPTSRCSSPRGYMLKSGTEQTVTNFVWSEAEYTAKGLEKIEGRSNVLALALQISLTMSGDYFGPKNGEWSELLKGSFESYVRKLADRSETQNQARRVLEMLGKVTAEDLDNGWGDDVNALFRSLSPIFDAFEKDSKISAYLASRNAPAPSASAPAMSSYSGSGYSSYNDAEDRNERKRDRCNDAYSSCRQGCTIGSALGAVIGGGNSASRASSALSKCTSDCDRTKNSCIGRIGGGSSFNSGNSGGYSSGSGGSSGTGTSSINSPQCVAAQQQAERAMSGLGSGQGICQSARDTITMYQAGLQYLNVCPAADPGGASRREYEQGIRQAQEAARASCAP